MKIRENVTVYSCEFCKKKLFKKQAMELHEKWCDSNPENKKACAGCINLEDIKIPYTVFGFNGYSEVEENREAKGFRCKHFDKILYPLKVEKKGLALKYPETFENQEPMPKECDQWKPF